MRDVIKAMSEIAAPVVAGAGCTLWDVEHVKEAGQWFLRVYIDCDGGVSIDQCEAVSRALDPLLDELALISGSYTFEVSSAGAERALKRPSDFERFMGSSVCVKLYRNIEGGKEHAGILAGYEDGDVVLKDGEKSRRFDKSDVALVRLKI